MLTTIHLPDDLLRDAERLAAQTDRTLTGVIEDALRAALRRSVRLKTYGRGGTLPGVDLDDSASLAER